MNEQLDVDKLLRQMIDAKVVGGAWAGKPGSIKKLSKLIEDAAKVQQAMLVKQTVIHAELHQKLAKYIENYVSKLKKAIEAGQTTTRGTKRMELNIRPFLESGVMLTVAKTKERAAGLIKAINDKFKDLDDKDMVDAALTYEDNDRDINIFIEYETRAVANKESADKFRARIEKMAISFDKLIRHELRKELAALYKQKNKVAYVAEVDYDYWNVPQLKDFINISELINERIRR